MALFSNKEKQKIESIGSTQRDIMIKRLERERAKINSEIENILANYAKESGNSALKKKRFRLGKHSNDWLYIGED